MGLLRAIASMRTFPQPVDADPNVPDITGKEYASFPVWDQHACRTGICKSMVGTFAIDPSYYRAPTIFPPLKTRKWQFPVKTKSPHYINGKFDALYPTWSHHIREVIEDCYKRDGDWPTWTIHAWGNLKELCRREGWDWEMSGLTTIKIIIPELS